jgi:SAM-dependent methyltransferase
LISVMARRASGGTTLRHGYLAQMRDAKRDMPAEADRPTGAEVRTLANYWRHRLLRGRRTFTLAGRSYEYFFGRYNTTWHTERVVEIPVVWEIARRFRPDRVLEVGNVLPHYFMMSHSVLDKDEAAPGVLNVDVVDFTTDRRFDLILSVSTLEHVGWDYSDRAQPDKIVIAIERLRSLLTPTGRLLVTLPMGYNPHLDRLLHDGRLHFDGLLAMQRISRDNRWRETEWSDVLHARYNAPFPGANGLVFGVIGADGDCDLPGLGAVAPARVAVRSSPRSAVPHPVA